jgi:hypothetical protein
MNKLSSDPYHPYLKPRDSISRDIVKVSDAALREYLMHWLVAMFYTVHRTWRELQKIRQLIMKANE